MALECRAAAPSERGLGLMRQAHGAAHRSAETCASALSQPAADRTAQRSRSVARALVTYSTLPAAALPASAASRFFTRKRAVCAARNSVWGGAAAW